MATRSLRSRSICGLNTWKLLRPRSFAWYMAVSACLSSSPMVAPSRGNMLTPMDTVATIARPSIITGADSTSLMRVAAPAYHDVGRSHRCAYALGDFLQQLVADLVAARIVDVLKAIQVEEQHRE